MTNLGRMGFVEKLLHKLDERRTEVETMILSGRFDEVSYKAACKSRETWTAARELIVETLNEDERAEIREHHQP